MSAEPYSRHITFESVSNFRDIGGYRTNDDHEVAWRRLFRSGDLRHISSSDLTRLKEEIRLTSVIDLRSSIEVEKQGNNILSEASIRYFNIPFITGSGNRNEEEKLFQQFTNMGEFYIHIVQNAEFGKRLVKALEIIAEPDNHPLVFHCAIGKDRTGILTAVLLSVLGVENKYIIEDYALSAPFMEELINRMKVDSEMAKAAEPLPGYFWKAAPESMHLFLSTLQQDYGSVRGYLQEQGAEASLFYRLEKALLI
jgi:protein-tyrosine phosphatase